MKLKKEDLMKGYEMYTHVPGIFETEDFAISSINFVLYYTNSTQIWKIIPE